MLQSIFTTIRTCLSAEDSAHASGPMSAKIRPSTSITKRLTILFALITFLLLSSVGGALYKALQHKLEGRDMDELSSRVHLVRNYLRQLQAGDDFRIMSTRWENAATVGGRVVHLILADEQGNILLRSNAHSPSGHELLQHMPQNIITRDSSWIWRQEGADTLRVIATWGRLGDKDEAADAQRILIGLCIPTTETTQMLGEAASILLLTIVLGTLIGGAMGFWVARRALMPIAAITRKAQEITANRLDQRLPPREVPEEFYELATAFNGMLERLDDAFRRQSELSSDLAHELRTPINSLMLQAQVALSQARSNDEYQEILHCAVEEYQALSRMIEGMLFLARADNAEAVLNREALALHEEAACVSEFYLPLAEEQELSITVSGQATIQADKTLLRRALGNLIANAIKHTPAGGRIEITVSPRDKNKAVLSISNPGPGIDAEHLPRLFDRFYCANKARTPGKTGTGLGLAIVRSIMQLHGGDVTVASTPGQTTTFELIFTA